MTRRAADDKPTLPPGADATRRHTAEARARESWLPPNRVVFEVPPDGLLLGGHVFAGLPVLTMPDLARAFVPDRGRAPKQRGRPRAVAERLALALRAMLALREGRARSLRKALWNELVRAGVPGDRRKSKIKQGERDARMVARSPQGAAMLDLAARLLDAERERLRVVIRVSASAVPARGRAKVAAVGSSIAAADPVPARGASTASAAGAALRVGVLTAHAPRVIVGRRI